MRTLRLCLAGSAILALLGGLGGAVLAQDDGTALPEPVVVTGTFGVAPLPWTVNDQAAVVVSERYLLSNSAGDRYPMAECRRCGL